MKTLRILFLLSLILFIGSNYHSANAQQIKGKVLTEENNEIMPYANIAIKKLPLNRIITGGVSNITGEFSIDVEPGKYVAIISVVGYQDFVIKNIEITEDNFNTGDIYLKTSEFILSEVQVTAERSFIENHPGKQVLNVGREITGGGGNISNVLKLVPSVEVTARGDISIRGNENIKVLINGKEMAYGIDPATLLKQLPAATVEKVEVITNASVSEDPESAGGAINVIIKKNSNDGFHYGFNVEAGGIPFKGNAGFTLNYAKNKLNTYLTYGFYLDNYKFSNKGTRIMNSENTLFSKISDNGLGKYRDIGHLVLGGIDYDISDRTTLNLEFTHNRYNEKWEYDLDNVFSTQGEPSISAIVRNENDEDIQFSDISARLESKLKEGHELTSMIHYSGGKQISDRIISEKGSFYDEERITNIMSDAKFHVGEISVDYSRPVWKNGSIETGINTEAVLYSADQITSGSQSEKKIWKYNQQKHAAYLLYKHKFGKLQTGFGIRPEYYKSITEEVVFKEKIPQEYSSLFPNLQVQYQLGNSKVIQNINMSYSRRIRRPSAEELDPIADYANPSHIFQGNPRLKPEFINNLELAYNYLEGSKKINLTVFARKNTNVIQQKTDLLENGSLFTSYINHSSSHDYGFELNGKIDPVKIWELSLSGSYYRSHYAKLENSHVNYHKIGSSLQAKLNNYIKINSKNTVQVQAQFYGKTIGMYYTRQPYGVLNIGYERKVFSGKGRLGISLNDVFNSGGIEKYEVIGPGFVSKTDWILDSRMLKVSFNIYIN